MLLGQINIFSSTDLEVDPRTAPPMSNSIKIKPVALNYYIIMIMNVVLLFKSWGIIVAESVLS